MIHTLQAQSHHARHEQWKKQRNDLVESFLPLGSLSQIFDVSSARAEKCAQNLLGMSKNGREIVDFSEFFLHEAQAQLQVWCMMLLCGMGVGGWDSSGGVVNPRVPVRGVPAPLAVLFFFAFVWPYLYHLMLFSLRSLVHLKNLWTGPTLKYARREWCFLWLLHPAPDPNPAP